MQSIKTELESDEPTSSSISIVDVGLDTDEVIDEEIKPNFYLFRRLIEAKTIAERGACLGLRLPQNTDILRCLRMVWLSLFEMVILLMYLALMRMRGVNSAMRSIRALQQVILKRMI